LKQVSSLFGFKYVLLALRATATHVYIMTIAFYGHMCLVV